jgi:hypothetical protein
MTAQQIQVSAGSAFVGARTVRRFVVVAGALVIEAVLIMAVVLSSVGVAPSGQPTPGGRIPAPTTSH